MLENAHVPLLFVPWWPQNINKHTMSRSGRCAEKHKVHMHMRMLVAWAKIILLVAWAQIFNNEFPALVVVNSNGLARSDPIDRSSCQTRQGCERGMRSGAGKRWGPRKNHEVQPFPAYTHGVCGWEKIVGLHDCSWAPPFLSTFPDGC
jgi:hypothetical protein